MKRGSGWLAKGLAGLGLAAIVFSAGCGTHVTGGARLDKLRRLHRVAVLPFAVPRGAPPELAKSIAEELSAHFVDAPFEIVERAQIEKVMREQDLELTDSFDPRTAARIGALVGADGVVLGRVTDYRDEAAGQGDTTLGVSMRCVQTETGTLIFATNAAQNAAGAFCGSEMNCLRNKMVTEMSEFVLETMR